MLRRSRLTAGVGLSIAFARVSGLLAGVPPAVFDVDTETDAVDVSSLDGLCLTSLGECSLRAAVMQANAVASAGSIIHVPGGLYELTLGPEGLDGPESGDLNLTAGNGLISLVGAGTEFTIIDGKLLDRVLSVDSGRAASLSSLTMRNGKRGAGGNSPSSGAPGRADDPGGGGISSFGTLTLTSCVVRNNAAPGGGGGGIHNLGTLTLLATSVIANTALSGAGLYNADTLTLTRSLVAGNIAENLGGGILNVGDLSATNSTISTNFANFDGGGVYNLAPGDAELYNVTIAFNHADFDADSNGLGGGVYNDENGIFNLRNSLLAGNVASEPPLLDDCNGTLGFYGRNRALAIPKSCTPAGPGSVNALTDLDEFGPLQNNGGPSWTHALLPFSVAIDDADPDLGCIGADAQTLPTDQRGAPRSLGNGCDVGAYEFGAIFLDGFESGGLAGWEI